MSNASSIPADAIQRVLFVCAKTHVYTIPPLTSNKGYAAATWTENNNARQIFTARVRVLETSIPPPATAPDAPEKVTVEVLLEDPSTGDLFAGAPYSDKHVIEAAMDSSRFFAIRVVGDGGQKAMLGIGFEERSEAIDFGICLQECRKTLDLEAGAEKVSHTRKSEGVAKKDWSLKEGQTIKIDIGKRAMSNEGSGGVTPASTKAAEEKALFSIKPPPDMSSGVPALAPPPSAQEARAQKRRSRGLDPASNKTNGLGFDDDFGEFQ